MERIDCHTHTYLSGHGEGTVEEVVTAAVAAGLSTIALTEHLPLPIELDPDHTFTMDARNVDLYLNAVVAAREAHPEIEVITGTEADWRVGAQEWLIERLGPYEIVLGSVHMLSDGWAHDNAGQIAGWETHDVDAVWREYFELWCDAVASEVPFTIMAHPDLPKKFGFRPTFDLGELFAHAAACAARHDVMVEVNTAGLRKPVKEVYPGPDFLKALCDAGVDCTVSSDAHSPSEVAFGIDHAYTAMRQAGYTRVTVPTRSGDRRYIELD